MKRDYSNSEVEKAINEYVHNSTYRLVLKDRYINGLTYEELGEKYGYSVTHIKTIVYRHENKIFR